MESLTLTIPFAKIDKSRREVWGYATKEMLDQQGEVVDYEASKRAFTKWSNTFKAATAGRGPEGESLGNIREMHGPKTVGKAIAVAFDDKAKGVWLGAKLSESTDGEDAWKKVCEGVLNGFSIGAPTAKRELGMTDGVTHPVQRVVDFDLSETSLVDNPACPGSFFQTVKLATAGALTKAAGLMDEDAAPRGTDFVKTSTSKEREMDAGTLLKQAESIEKAGKKIGPHQTPASHAPGEQKPTVPAVEPTPTPVSVDDAKTAGIHDDSQEQVKVPDGMGKDWGAPPQPGAGAPPPPGGHPGFGAPPPPPRPPAPPPQGAPMQRTPPPPMDGGSYGFCAYCGSKMAAADSGHPYHAACKETTEIRKMAEGLNLGKVASMFKAFGAEIEGVHKALGDRDKLIKAQGDVISDLQKRVKTIEDAPLPGGPMKTDLPSGVQVVEKGAGVGGGASAEAVLKSMFDAERDPLVKQAISKQLALISMKGVHGGK